MKLNDFFDSYNKLEKALSDIKNCICKARVQNELFSKTEIFYNGLIISLYGLFEKFIDDIGNDYLTFILNSKAHNTGLGEEIKNGILCVFRQNFADFLSNPGRHTDIDDTNQNLTSILNSYLLAIANGDLTTLDKKLLLIHGGNMRSSVLFEFFNKLKISNLPTNICSKIKFRKFIINDLGIEEGVIGRIQGQNSSDIYFCLNRLVDERNLVAHSGKSENKISLDELTNKTIPFLLAFTETLTICIAEWLIPIFEIEYSKEFTDDSLINVFDNCILCHENESHNIRQNGFFVLLNNSKFIISRILTIELNKESLIETGVANDKFGFKVSDSIKCDTKLIAYI